MIMDFLVEQKMFGSKILGARIAKSSGRHIEKVFQNGYSISTENGVFSGLFLNFTDGFHAYKTFEGTIGVKGQRFVFNEQTSVKEIETVLGHAVDGFKDDVEINRRFVLSGLQIDCSWYHDADGIAFTYMFIEKDDGFYQTSDFE